MCFFPFRLFALVPAACFQPAAEAFYAALVHEHWPSLSLLFSAWNGYLLTTPNWEDIQDIIQRDAGTIREFVFKIFVRNHVFLVLCALGIPAEDIYDSVDFCSLLEQFVLLPEVWISSEDTTASVTFVLLKKS